MAIAHELLKRRFDSPDRRQTYEHGEIDLLDIHGTSLGLVMFDPGWRWSEDVKPLVGTETCEGHHVGYAISGRLHVEMNDGTAVDVQPGDVFDVPPGHDAWVLGDEQAVHIQVSGVDSLLEK